MTQERQPKDHRVRNAGILTAGALAIALGGVGVGGAFRGENAKASYAPNPTATELATQRPSEAAGSPSGSPEPSSSPEAFQTFSLQPGEKMAVESGDVVAGDVAMADTDGGPILPLYDTDTHKASDVQDNTKTALYVVVQKPGELYAPYGGFVARGLTPDKLQTWLELQKIEKQRSSFSKVDVVTWTGYDTTVDEAGFTANGGQGTAPSVNIENGNTIPTVETIQNMDTKTKLETIINLFINNKIDPNSPDAQKLLEIFAECLCGCAVPTESPSPSPMPSTSPEVCPDKGYADKLYDPAKGPVRVTTNGLIVRGDVTINGKVYHDQLGATQAVDWIWTDTPKTYTITGPNKADVLWTTCPSKDIWVEQVDIAKEQAKEDGRPMDKNVIQKGL